MRINFGAGADRLTRAYPTLSPSLKKCAIYLLEHPIEVATLTMRQVASRAGVPPSTMTRLARAVGFSGYASFRDVYRESINRQCADRYRKAGSPRHAVGETDLDRTLDAFQQSALHNVNTLFDELDREALERAVRALANARQIHVAGSLESYSIANYFQGIASLGFRNWRLAARHNGELACLIEPLTETDVIVAIAFRPWADDTIQVVRHAQSCGSRVIGITDLRTSPLAAASDDILLVPNRSPSLFQSYVAATALVEVLAGLVVAHGGRAAAESIGHQESIRNKSGVYWRE